MKKIISLVLTFALLFCGISVGASSKNQTVITGPSLKLLNNGEFPEISSYNFKQNPSAMLYDAEPTKEELLMITLYNGMFNVDEIIDISALGYSYTQDSANLIFAFIQYIINHFHELFAVGTGSIEFLGNGSIMTGVKPTYTMTKAEYAEKFEFFSNTVYEIINGMDKDFTDLEKAIYVHDYLAANYEYDYDLKIYDAYNFFAQKKGVCQAYTQAYTTIMQQLGIPCTEALDDIDNHTWNIIQIGNNTYHVDITWDDSGYGTDLKGYVGHSYFLLSDTGIKGEAGSGDHTEWYTIDDSTTEKVTCNDSSYETGYVWLSSFAQMQYFNNNWYYISETGDNNGKISYTNDFKLSNTVISIPSSNYMCNIYDTNGQEIGIFPYFTSGLSLVGNTLYYNTSTSIKYFNLSNNTDGTVNNFGSSGNNIYSVTYSGSGSFEYSTAKWSGTVSGNSIVNILPSCTKNTYTITNKGDINRDGSINATDIANVKEYILTGISSFDCASADVSDDKGITIKDYVRIKKRAAGVISAF